MGFPSLREDILERITEGLSSLLRDAERGHSSASTTVEEARLEAIKRVQTQVGRVLDDYLEIATTPGLELAERIKALELEVAALRSEVALAKKRVTEEQTRTKEARQQIKLRDGEIVELKKENERLQMKVAFLSVKENGGPGPVRSRRS